MRIETLNERIKNAESKIEKKRNTISKKAAAIEKKRNQVSKTYGIDPDTYDKYKWQEFGQEKGWNLYWTLCEIDSLVDDIKRLTDEIAETEISLEKYRGQLAGEIAKDEIFIKEIPESMRRMQMELVERWDAYDIERRNTILQDYREMGYKAFCKKHNAADRDFMYKTNEQIHKANEDDAKAMILDLYNRIKDITGEITDWSGVEAAIGTWGMTVLNGVVIGKEGRAVVESIFAGGYNIQRLHVRVLVKSIG